MAVTPLPTQFAGEARVAETVPGLFLATVRRLENRVALRYKHLGLWRDVSWQEYFGRAREAGLGLRTLGLEKGDRVAVLGENCPEWVVMDLAIQCAGGVTVGLYTTSSWQQCRYILNHSEVRFLVVENEEQLDKWLKCKDDCPTLEKVILWDWTGLRDFHDPGVMGLDELSALGRKRSEEQPGLFEECIAGVEPADTAVIVYTSGTTGPPKGAMLSHRNLVWIARTMGELDPDVRLNERDEVLSFLPLCHIFERLFSVFLHVTYGYTVNFVESLDTVAENLREVSPTVGYAVPRLWEKYASTILLRMSDATFFKRLVFGAAAKIGRAHAMARLDGRGASPPLSLAYGLACLTVLRKLKQRLGFDRMRVAYSGAAPIAPDVLRFYHALGLPLVEGYGQTESSGVLTATRLQQIRLGTVGRPLPGVEILIAEDGEILARSPGVFQGYFKDPTLTAQTIDAEGWLHTGDIGEMDFEGFVRIVDRKKDLIITSGGKNVAPQYIENKLKFSPYIYDAVVIGEGRSFLTALIVLDEENVVKYTQDNRIPFSTYSELAGDREINKLIDREVAEVNQQLSRVENVRKFRILPRRLYEEDGEVTPTMKVKRTSVNEAYHDLIESMYRE